MYPERKVGLVTFTDTIDIVGDGHLPNTSIGGENLENYDFIMKNGLACATTQFTKSVKEVSENLKQKVNNLRPLGSTALGPGLLTAIALAGEGSLGS